MILQIMLYYFFQQFGNKVGEGEFRGKALPTYVFPDCLKAAIRERLSGDLRDYPNPETPAVSVFHCVSLSSCHIIIITNIITVEPCPYLTYPSAMEVDAAIREFTC